MQKTIKQITGDRILERFIFADRNDYLGLDRRDGFFDFQAMDLVTLRVYESSTLYVFIGDRFLGVGDVLESLYNAFESEFDFNPERLVFKFDSCQFGCTNIEKGLPFYLVCDLLIAMSHSSVEALVDYVEYFLDDDYLKFDLDSYLESMVVAYYNKEDYDCQRKFNACKTLREYLSDTANYFYTWDCWTEDIFIFKK